MSMISLNGTPTKMKDKDGLPLFVGDCVELFDSEGNSYGIASVVECEGVQFIMGIKGRCKASGEIVGWSVVKQSEKEEYYHDI